MAKHDIAGFETRGRGLPTGAEPIGEEFIVCWIAIPHGDRQDGTQSGCGIHDETSVSPPNDDVVAVLVLDDDPREKTCDLRFGASSRPVGERFAERAVRLQQSDEFRITGFRSRDNGTDVHDVSAP